MSKKLKNRLFKSHISHDVSLSTGTLPSLHIHGRRYGLNVRVSQNSHVESLAPRVVAAGDGASKEVIFSEVIRLGPCQTGFLSFWGKAPETSLCTHYRGRWGHNEKVAIKSGRVHTRKQTAGTLILDFRPPALWENTFLSFKPPSLWHFAVAAQAKIAGAEGQRKHAVNRYWINQIRWDLGSEALGNITRIFIHVPPSKISACITMENGIVTGSNVEPPKGCVWGTPSPLGSQRNRTSSLMQSGASSTCPPHRKANSWLSRLLHSLITRSWCGHLIGMHCCHHSALFRQAFLPTTNKSPLQGHHEDKLLVLELNL